MANSRNSRRLVLLALAVLAVLHGGSEARSKKLPRHLIPRRSSQIRDGFGINSDLPRVPYIPWNRWWWTRIFDAGINFIRIGQYENSSDYTSWDWVERKRGGYSSISMGECNITRFGTSPTSITGIRCLARKNTDGYSKRLRP